MAFDLQACLRRIGYRGGREVNIENLAALQSAFLYNVPFENLDIHLNRPITLEPENFYRKIVENNRGGFCYECNTLFHGTLISLGFEVDFVAAAMLIEAAGHVDFEHMALLVKLHDEEFLVDVGNGQSCLQPLRIDGSDEVRCEGIDYRVGEYEQRLALYYREAGADWLPRFSFTTTPRTLQDYAERCHYIQTSSQSHFTQRKVLTLARPNGRVTLAERELEICSQGNSEKSLVRTNREYAEVLDRYFGIRIPQLPEHW